MPTNDCRKFPELQTVTKHRIKTMSNNLLTKTRPIAETPTSLGVRDHLAVDRTILANERTLLAYVRTALGFVVLGLTFLHFLDELGSRVTAWGFLGIGGLVFVFGILRFTRMKRDLDIDSVRNRITTD